MVEFGLGTRGGGRIFSLVFFLIARCNVGAHNARTLTSMNTHMQTLPLRAHSSMTEPLTFLTLNVKGLVRKL
jgi:hypothetical protein